ncbi:MAG: hypothetical protein JO267_07910 [Alphaproteobacteria bacterium]|nr:hypothetical protein [Alphaproteobacteria bacterium]
MKSENPHGLMPPGLIEEIEAAAREERRDPRDLVGDAIRRYLAERNFFRPDETHRKIAEALESLREGKGLDGEAVMAEMLAKLETPPYAR